MDKSVISLIIAGIIFIGAGLGIVILDNNDTQTTDTATSEQVVIPERTLLQSITDNPDMTTLIRAVAEAGYSELLNGNEEFTIFAPDNTAFAALPAGTTDSLFLTENEAQLQDVLDYHIIEGSVALGDITGDPITTKNGKTLSVEISLSDGGITLIDGQGNRSDITTPDVRAGNGYIHVVDHVLLAE